MLVVALATTVFAAQQASAAEKALDQARDASKKADQANEAMATFQKRHVAIQVELEEFRSSFLSDSQQLIRDLNSLTALIGEQVQLDSFDKKIVEEKWRAARTKIRTLKQAARQINAIDTTDQLNCFSSDYYDGVTTSFDTLLNEVEPNKLADAVDGVEKSVGSFIASLKLLCTNANASILASIYQD